MAGENSVGVTVSDDDQVRLILRDPDNPEHGLVFVFSPAQAEKFAVALQACAAHASNRAYLRRSGSYPSSVA